MSPGRDLLLVGAGAALGAAIHWLLQKCPPRITLLPRSQPPKPKPTHQVTANVKFKEG